MGGCVSSHNTEEVADDRLQFGWLEVEGGALDFLQGAAQTRPDAGELTHQESVGASLVEHSGRSPRRESGDDVQQLQEQQESMDARLQEFVSVIAELRESFDALKAEFNASSRDTTQRLDHQRESMESQLGDLGNCSSSVIELRIEVDALKSHFACRLEEQHALVQVRLGEVGECSASIADLRAAVDAVHAEVGESGTIAQRFAQQLNEQRSCFEALLADSVSERQKSMDAQLSGLAACTSKVVELRATVDALCHFQQSAAQRLEEVRASMASGFAELDPCKSDVDVLRAAFSAQQDELEARGSGLVELRVSLEALTSDVAAQRQSAQDLFALFDAFRSDVRAACDEARTTAHRVDEHHKSMEIQLAQLAVCTSDMRDLRSAFVALQADVKSSCADTASRLGEQQLSMDARLEKYRDRGAMLCESFDALKVDLKVSGGRALDRLRAIEERIAELSDLSPRIAQMRVSLDHVTADCNAAFRRFDKQDKAMDALAGIVEGHLRDQLRQCRHRDPAIVAQEQPGADGS